MKKTLLIFVFFAQFFMGCVHLHQYQLGDINSNTAELEPFELIISETGVNLDQAAEVAENAAFLLGNAKAGESAQEIKDIISMFQWGPKTGNPVYSENYSKRLFNDLDRECPGGQISHLEIARETREYPVVSGEIVKLTGLCAKKRKI